MVNRIVGGGKPPTGGKPIGNKRKVTPVMAMGGRMSSRNRHIDPGLIMSGAGMAMNLVNGFMNRNAAEKAKVAAEENMYREQQGQDQFAYNNYAVKGNNVDMYMNGGSLPMKGTNPITKYNYKGGDLNPIASDTVEVTGNSHGSKAIDGQYGVTLQDKQTGENVAEVEGGEVIKDDFVTSNRLMYDKKHSFADKLKQLATKRGKLEQKLDKHSKPITRNTIERQLAGLNMAEDVLMQKQEQVKQMEGQKELNSLDNKPVMAMGGNIPKYSTKKDDPNYRSIDKYREQYMLNSNGTATIAFVHKTDNTKLDNKKAKPYLNRIENDNLKKNLSRERLESNPILSAVDITGVSNWKQAKMGATDIYQMATKKGVDFKTKDAIQGVLDIIGAVPLVGKFATGAKAASKGIQYFNKIKKAVPYTSAMDTGNRVMEVSKKALGGRLDSKNRYINPGTIEDKTVQSEIDEYGKDSFGAKIAPYLDNVVSAIDTFTAPKLATPLMNRAANLETRVNVNPQLAKINRSITTGNKNILDNTSNSNIARNAMTMNRLQGLSTENDILAQKEQQEIGLRNQDAMNKQGINNANIALTNAHAMNEFTRQGDLRSNITTNAVNLGQDLKSNQQRKDMLQYNKIEFANKMRADKSGSSAMAILADPNSPESDKASAREHLKALGIKTTPTQNVVSSNLRPQNNTSFTTPVIRPALINSPIKRNNRRNLMNYNE